MSGPRRERPPGAAGESGRPRVLAIMGSGETAPTMAKVHRRLAARLSGGPPVGALLDTPYGFQENADDITARALEYFERNVGIRMVVAPFRRADEDTVLRATALARLRDADYVFSGPGSPTYALRQWRDTEIPALITEKLERGGIVTFASAAALTLGAFTVPVYEVYKVGEEPHWLPGLDILGPLGLPVAVIPHYDNAEGGNHDTRFCYLGEKRLTRLETELPATHFVLGIDSHTCLLLDFGDRSATVVGLGGVVVRVAGRSRVLEPGPPVGIDELVGHAEDLRTATAGTAGGSASTVPSRGGPEEGSGGRLATEAPLLDEALAVEARFDAAAGRGDLATAVRAVLQVEELLVAWSRDTGGTDEVDRARAVLQALIVRLAEVARSSGAPGAPSSALVDLLVELRDTARARHDYVLGDRIRDVLATEGVELRDGPAGTEWRVSSGG